jgi:hypothetical protein
MTTFRLAIGTLALALTLITGSNLAQAQEKQAPINVSKTVWGGGEILPGAQKATLLMFGFGADGKAIMVDEESAKQNKGVTGTWTQNGNQVTITFGNCVYRGTLNGDILAGTAQFNTGETWTFAVKLDPKGAGN